MLVDHNTGLLLGARSCPSPNCDQRPEGVEPDLIVIHAISLPPGEFGGPWIDHLFGNCLDGTRHPYFSQICSLNVSAHLLIRRDGETVQYVPFHDRAWHAGHSSYDGRESCNDFSIGIELEGDEQRPFDERQYLCLTEVCLALLQNYPKLSAEKIVGHSEIAPGRKSDPGPHFDWGRLRSRLSAK